MRGYIYIYEIYIYIYIYERIYIYESIYIYERERDESHNVNYEVGRIMALQRSLSKFELSKLMNIMNMSCDMEKEGSSNRKNPGY